MIACLTLYDDVVEVLLDNGADVNLLNNNGSSALIIASATCCTFDLINIKPLLLNSRLIRVKDHCTRSSNERGYLKIVQTLLHHGAEVNAKDEAGLSALNIACFNGDIELLKLLINHGCRIDSEAITIATKKEVVEPIPNLVTTKIDVLIS